MSIDDILAGEQIQTLFQPIVDLSTADIIGYEALSRGPAGTPMFSPVHMIEAAHQENKLWALEALFRKSAIRSASKQLLTKLLFINVDPNVVADPKFQDGFTRQYLVDHKLSPEMVVFEITERSILTNNDRFQSAMQHYRQQGYMLAIDDTGAGYSNLNMLLKINPVFIKIDMELIRNIHQNHFQQAIIKSFVNLANMTNTKLIAEGIEQYEELKTLIRLGVHAGQGFYFSKPVPLIAPLDEQIVQQIQQISADIHFMHSYNTRYIGEICEQIPHMDANAPCVEVKRQMEVSGVDGICLLQDGYISGLMMKTHLNATLSSQYGFSLFAKKPVRRIMDKSCLIVDDTMPVSMVSELAMKRGASSLYDHIIVKRCNAYLGLVPVMKLLRHAIDIEKSYALEMNPLTGLPGNTQINRMLHEAIRFKDSKCLLYVDLDHFKAFNDMYGFEHGDHIIRITKDVLLGIVKDQYQMTSFIGHVGGDDFVILLHANENEVHQVCSEMMELFDLLLSDYMSSLGRTSRPKSMTSISIAGLYGDLSIFHSPEELANQLSDIKKKAKAISGSAFVLESTYQAENDRFQYVSA